MEPGDGGASATPANQSDITAELAALDAEIARLSLRRDQLRAQAAAQVATQIAPPAGTSVAAPAGAAQPQADWYPDPSGRFSWRYWDGREWTDSVARNGKTYKDPPVASTPVSSPSHVPPTTRSTSVNTSTTATRTPIPGPIAGSSTAPTAPTNGSAPRPTRVQSDIDVGKLILILGAALLIGGVAGLTVWLWSRLPAVGRLALLGLAFILQTGIAVRIRERLQTAAEAFAATGAATLLFAIGSVAATATWDGAVGVAVAAVGIVLLLLARFRAWVIAGHAAIAVGAVAVIVAEPWSQTALIIAIVVGVVRLVGVGASKSLRPQNFDVLPEWLTATTLAALLAIPALALPQFDHSLTALVFALVALVTSEVVVRSRTAAREHEFSLIAGAVAASAGVVWSIVLWSNGGRSDGFIALSVTAVVALLLWRVGRTEVELQTGLFAFAAGLAPVAARFACDPASRNQLIIFCAAAAVLGVAVTWFTAPGADQQSSEQVMTSRLQPGAIRFIDKPVSLWVWVGAVIASFGATEQLATWPRLALLTVALVSMVPIMKFDELAYVAALTATLTVADLLYNESFAASWWFRPDLIGVAAAVSLYLANRAQKTPWWLSIGNWKVPRHWESAVALLVVPVGEVATQTTFKNLSTESVWRLVLVGGLTLASWTYGATRRTRPNVVQLATALAVAAVIVSRVADESPAIRTGAWIVIGCISTLALALSAWMLKRDELRYASAATATATVAVALYGDLFVVTWWFRPDLIGAVAALALLVANRTQSSEPSLSIGTWKVPRYWESAMALLLVPTVDLMSRPAFADLSSRSKWRLGFLAVFSVAAWAYGAAKRARPNAAQLVALAAVAIVTVSRVGDESLRIRTAAWVILGFTFVVAALRLRRVVLLVPAAACWMLVVVMYSPPGPLEVLTGSLAAIAAAVALLARRFGRRGTIDFIPAAAVALVPSAFVAAKAVLNADVDSEQVTRIAIVLVVAAIALAVGTYKRLAALVAPSVVALVALAVAQLVVVQRRTSGWVSALVAGVVLLVVGTRLEYLRSVSRRAGDFVRSLR